MRNDQVLGRQAGEGLKDRDERDERRTLLLLWLMLVTIMMPKLAMARQPSASLLPTIFNHHSSGEIFEDVVSLEYQAGDA